MTISNFPFPEKSILLVEDNKDNQDLMIDMIEFIKCKIDIAENGTVAVEKWKKNKYDLIIMDIQMPEMDGYRATREIRALENNTTHIPILALTASALAFDKQKCFEAGMDDYLSKPITIDIFEDKLKEIFIRFTQPK